MPKPIELQVDSPRGQQTILVAPVHALQRLTELLRREDLALNTRCGQRGLCDGCMIELRAGTLVSISGSEKMRVRAGQEPLHVRACEYRLGEEAVSIHIPARSILAYEPQVVSEFKINVTSTRDPLWQRLAIPRQELPGIRPLMEEIAAAVARRCNNHSPARLSALGTQQKLPAGDGPVFVTVEYRGDCWLVDELSDVPAARALGAAIDVGTTTVAVMLVDLTSGEIVGRGLGFNRQMHLGDDVLTRINLCTTDPAMIGKLQEAIVRGTLGPLLGKALAEAGADTQQIKCVAIAGNTTMLHLLAGVDPSPMGVAPFIAPFLSHRMIRASEIRLEPSEDMSVEEMEQRERAGGSPVCHQLSTGSAEPPTRRIVEEEDFDPPMHLLPGAAAYVGADLTAGTFASGLIYDDGPSLLVDVGTNGEIILKHKGKLYGCATAAGPAFEGAGLACGIRAGDGAISHVRFSANPFVIETDVIGQARHARPLGICGSAYVDIIGQAKKIGLLSETGRFDLSAVPDAKEHVILPEHSTALRLAFGQGRRDIYISEVDISRLLQAKAAIAAGILTLLERVNLAPADVKTLYLAGGFGMHLNLDSAFACGLLPGFRQDQIQLVGNTSLAGAYLALLDSGAIQQLAAIGRQMEIVELNVDPNFEMRYIDQLAMP